MDSDLGITAPALAVLRRYAAWLCLPALLAACGGGGGGGGGSQGSAQLQSLNTCQQPTAVCTGVQLGGAVTGAAVSVTPLFDPLTQVEQGRTPSVEEVRQAFGPEQWDALSDLEKLRRLGQFLNDASGYFPTSLYLARASGGEDQDSNADNRVDGASAQVSAAATDVLGAWHAVLPGDLIGSSNVTPLTEAVFRYLEPELPDLSAAEITDLVDSLARNSVGDVDGSGSVNYADLLAWDRHRSESLYLYDIAVVDELAAAVRGNATLATIRELSLAVLQVSGALDQTFTLSGSITVPPNHRVDGDVNNPAAPVTLNADFDSAQPLDNPVVLGGYANLPGEGVIGRSQSGGDIDDYYRINLNAGQVISLVIADSPNFNDLDLYLYDSNQELVDASVGVTGVEQLTVPADGDGIYFVRVQAYVDIGTKSESPTATSYQLSVGDTVATVRQQSLRLSDNFVPGQLIARFQDRPRVNSMRGRARFTGMRLRGGGLRRANLLEMAANSAETLKQRKLRTLLALKRLRDKEEVKSIGLNYRVAATAVPNDPEYFRQWHYPLINLPAAWDNPRKGDGVIVAVIDSGVRDDHPDLATQLLPGWDFFDDDSNPRDPGESTDGSPSSFHGTHVAGTVAAASDNGIGVAGVAWNARIMPLRVLGPGGGTSYDVLQAVRFAAGLENDSNTVPGQPADIINLSLAGGGFNSFEQQLYNDVANLGIITVAAAGNGGSSAFAYPASYDNVISVSAVNRFREQASYSNFGSAVDVAAPGGDSSGAVLSTGADDSGFSVEPDYTRLIGTSMASPHVAGTLALMKSIYPALTIGDVGQLLSQGVLTTDLGPAGRDNFYGWGLIDAKAAVDVAEDLAAGGGGTLQPSVCTSSSELNFGNFAEALPLSITNCGSGTLVVQNILPADAWVGVTPNAVNEDGLGRYTVHVDRSALPVGLNFSSLDIRTSDGDVTVQVVVEQPEPGTLATGDAGVHYILLLDATTGMVVDEAEVIAVDGVYDYEFTDVAPGVYEIIGGSDADNDFIVCDPGEACGAWPALDSENPEIEVDNNIDNLDFTTSFNDGIISTQQLGGSDSQATQEHRRSAYRGPNGER